MTDNSLSDKIMRRAVALATVAGAEGEVPVAAIITDPSGQIIAEAVNAMQETGQATAHAEMLAMQLAMVKTGAARLSDYDIWVTLEPCAMCAGAISHARLRRLYFGAYDPKGGAVEHGPCLFSQKTIHHHPEIFGGIYERACAELLRNFFKEKRNSSV